MRTAFVVLRSPQDVRPAHTIGRFAEPEDACVILFEDGVYNAVQQNESDELSRAAKDVLVCRDDFEARGLGADDLKTGKLAEYADIVDCIMERTERTLTV
jgi:sulfur relay protein TusB/DsrH